MANSQNLYENLPSVERAKDIVKRNPEDIPWYVKELTTIKPPARELLEKYSKIPSGDVVPHIKEIRDKAFQVYPYPCLGHWGFLDLSISASPQYDEILQRVKSGDKYLDIGCCVGQDIRKLVYDGAPSNNTFGSDLEQDFMEIGYDLFLDRSTLQTRFIAADILADDSDLKQLDGEIDIVHAASFFHLFDWPQQVRIAKRLVKIMKAKPGSLAVGRMIGMLTSGEFARQIGSSGSRFRHNEESWAKMWKEVGEATGTEWHVDAHMEEEDLGKKTQFMFNFLPEGTRWLTFTVRRV